MKSIRKIPFYFMFSLMAGMLFPMISSAATFHYSAKTDMVSPVKYVWVNPNYSINDLNDDWDFDFNSSHQRVFHFKMRGNFKNLSSLHQREKAPVQSYVPPQTTPISSNSQQSQPSAQGNTVQQPASPDLTTSTSNFQQRVVDLVNQERANAGLQPLTIVTDLTEVASVKAKDMSDNKYFDHNSPTLGSPFDLMAKYGINYSYAGENIAMGQATPEEVVQDWMNSPGHRANILNPNYTEIGVGVGNSYQGYGYIWVQEFDKR